MVKRFKEFLKNEKASCVMKDGIMYSTNQTRKVLRPVDFMPLHVQSVYQLII